MGAEKLKIDVNKAPLMIPWTEGLPDAKEQADGTFLPNPLDQEINKRLRYCDEYSKLCQQVIDSSINVCEVEKSIFKEGLEECSLYGTEGHSLITVALISAGSLLLGSLITVLIIGP